MTEKPRYLYFNFRARGELPRLVCAAGGLEFTDERIPTSEWGPKYKDDCPFGQIPCVVINGRWFAQKLAISLYFARLCDLYPKAASEMELLEMDHALQFTEEILENIIKGYVDKKFNNKPETLEKVKTETLPEKLPRLENLLKQNGTGFYVGNKLSIVDLSAYDVTEHVIDELGKAYLDKYPLVKANFEKVGQLPGVKKYVASRPKQEEGFDF